MYDEKKVIFQALLNIEELSQVLRIPTGSIRNQLCRGTFPLKPLKVSGRRIRFKAEDLKKYLESLENDQPKGGAA